MDQSWKLPMTSFIGHIFPKWPPKLRLISYISETKYFRSYKCIINKYEHDSKISKKHLAYSLASPRSSDDIITKMTVTKQLSFATCAEPLKMALTSGDSYAL